MRTQFKEVIILSAELGSRSFESNKQRTLNLEQCLSECGISYNAAKGSYNNVLEECFVVLPKNDTEIKSVLDFAFKNFNQESVLYQDTEGMSTLLFNSGKKESIGRLKRVSPKLAKEFSNYVSLNGVIYSTES